MTYVVVAGLTVLVLWAIKPEWRLIWEFWSEDCARFGALEQARYEREK